MDYIDENVSKEGLNFSPQLKYDLDNLAYWTRFLGIVGLVLSIIFILLILLGGSFLLSALNSPMAAGGGMPAAFGTFYLIFVGGFSAFYAYLSYLLFDSGRKLKAGLRGNSQYEVEAGISKLKTLFKIVGIMTMIIVIIYGVILVFALLAGSLLSFR
ncbi:MAG: hypothetical protein RLZZ546_3066 [Bacteroidota bacterium]|jgi:hypothetical protein